MADYLDPASLRAAFDGIKAAFVITPDFGLDETTAMGNVVDAVERAGSLVRLVRMTGDAPGHRDESQVFEVYPPIRKWDTGTGVVHLRGRKVLSASSVPVVYLNVLAWFFQDFANYMSPSSVNRRTLIMPAGRLMDFIDAGDIGHAAAELMPDPSRTRVGETYHLVNGVDRSTFGDLAALMTEAFGENITIESGEESYPPRRYYRFDGAPEYFLDYCKFEEAFIGSVGETPWETMLAGEAAITPGHLRFEPSRFRDWLTANRDAFLGPAQTPAG
uniref:SDR family oxidoreductase n=1 Tax=Streptomyces acidicola TaxID=2596892 RepID=UPI0018838B09|nr:NmrA family NAD(P)-binding protein [Streptomyces acidicola]